MKNKEVELKFVLINPTELKEKLDLLAISQLRTQYQKDVYYTPPHKDFLKASPITEWLRLRKTDNGSSFNYKKWHLALTETVACDEFEVVIDDDEKMFFLLSSLDFQELVTVEKYRISWKYKNAEISIDDVTGLGSFVEIEARGDFSSTEEAVEYIYSIANELRASLGAQDFRGYPYRILEQKGYRF